MMRAKKDLELSLYDPVAAREYIKKFDWGVTEPLRPRSFVLDSGREIYFRTMSDPEAVMIALTILRGIEIPREQKNLNLFAKFVH